MKGMHLQFAEEVEFRIRVCLQAYRKCRNQSRLQALEHGFVPFGNRFSSVASSRQYAGFSTCGLRLNLLRNSECAPGSRAYCAR
jgi:hypothetical protein